MSDWQPIETAPKNSTSRLVWNPSNQCIYCVTWDEDEDAWCVFGGYSAFIDTPTHWMPLPEPPK